MRNGMFQQTSNAERRTSNSEKVDQPLRRAMLILLGFADINFDIEQGTARSTYPSAAMTLSSIAIGVGRAVTSIVVRVGFGLPSPAKCSA
jgi:hypothetical protein